jgi:GAF domain-containing protein
MAIGDAQSDPRLASDIADSVGYVPETVLCVPLFYGDHVIGALELLDKEGDGSFSAGDMESLGLFANQAAVALQLSRTYENVAGFLAEAEGAGEVDEASRDTLELARLVQEIVRYGDSERKACRAILLGLAEYLRERSSFPDQLASPLG